MVFSETTSSTEVKKDFLEEGQYTATFSPPGNPEGTYRVDVVTLGEDSEEIEG